MHVWLWSAHRHETPSTSTTAVPKGSSLYAVVALTMSTTRFGLRTRESAQLKQRFSNNPRPFPLKRTIQTIDPLHPQRPTVEIQTTTGPRRFHLQATIQIPTPRLPTRPSGTIQTSDSLHPQRSTVNWHNLRSLSIASGVRLLEPAPLDWPKSQPNLLSLDIAHHVAMTHP